MSVRGCATIYTRIGDLLGWICVAGAVAMIGASLAALAAREASQPDLRTTRRVGITLLAAGSPAI